jgi:hypothetical protein
LSGVINNNALGQILWEQMILGYPEHGVRYRRSFVDYSAIALKERHQGGGSLGGSSGVAEPARVTRTQLSVRARILRFVRWSALW